MPPQKYELNRKPCRFCEWSQSLDRPLIHEELLKPSNRLLRRGRGRFAVLDAEPKVRGHTLVISRRHFSDTTEADRNSFLRFSGGVLEVSKLLKRRLLGIYDKVYVMSMSEHWNDDEIVGCKHTEHLHFHLLPRYGEMRRKDEAMELFFVRPPGVGFAKDVGSRQGTILSANDIYTLASVKSQDEPDNRLDQP